MYIFQHLNHANIPKTWRLRPQNWRFPKHLSNKPKRQNIFAMPFFTLLVVSVVLSCCSFVMRRFRFTIQANRNVSSLVSMLEGFPMDLSKTMFYGNQVGIGLRFSPQLD